MKKTFVIFIFLLFYHNFYAQGKDIQDEISAIIKSKALTNAQKINRLNKFADIAYKTRYIKALLLISDFFLNIKKYKQAIPLYRRTARLGLIKNNYLVLYACGLRLWYLVDRDEGALYLYQAGVRAMRNSDWYFTIKIAKVFIKMERYKSADKWLKRAGASAAMRKSANGMFSVSKVYETMGAKYRNETLYWYTAGMNLAKKKSGIQY